MTTKDIKQCQITLISKTGKAFVGFTDNDVLLNFMATIVKFVEIDVEKTGTIKLKDLLWKEKKSKDEQNCILQWQKERQFKLKI